jgi:hypothetical protein
MIMTRESRHFTEELKKIKNSGDVTFAIMRVQEIEHQEPDSQHVTVQLEKLRARLATQGIIIPPCQPKPAKTQPVKTKPVSAPVKRTTTKRSAKV